MRAAALALATAAALVLSTPATGETPARFLARANAVCAKGIGAMASVPAPESTSGYLGYFRREAALSDNLLLELAALDPPTSLEPSYRRAVVRQRAVESTLHALVAKLKTASDPKAVVRAVGPTLTKRTKLASEAWRTAGVVKCA